MYIICWRFDKLAIQFSVFSVIPTTYVFFFIFGLSCKFTVFTSNKIFNATLTCILASKTKVKPWFKISESSDGKLKKSFHLMKNYFCVTAHYVLNNPERIKTIAKSLVRLLFVRTIVIVSRWLCTSRHYVVDLSFAWSIFTLWGMTYHTPFFNG